MPKATTIQLLFETTNNGLLTNDNGLRMQQDTETECDSDSDLM